MSFIIQYNYISDIFIVLVISFLYKLLVLILSLIFSINSCGTISSSTSNNFECGFYSIITSSLRYRFNYWMIIIHFLLFEIELILALLLLYAWQVLSSLVLLCILLDMLFFDVLI